LYDSEQKTNKIFNYFTLIAIFISCLGLYGLAAYMAQQKTKEIGIRKVLGASIMNIMSGLSKEFILLVCLANAIAWPVAYYFMNKWLQHFATKTVLSVWVFVLSGLASLFIALLTISYQSVKAAAANPVKSLRYE
jgi:putative ABC transport system permease protein